MSVAMPVDLQPPPRRFTVDEFHRMIEAGVLSEQDSVELLEGWIVSKMVHNPRHDATVDRAREAIQGRLPPPWRVRVQSAITTEDSEPEPDLVVVPGPASRYETRHPGPEDIVLVVEVADSSLAHDRDVKARLYARAGIRTYWIINIPEQVVEIHTEPSGPATIPAYRQRRTCSLGQQIPLPSELREQPIPVNSFFAD